MALFETPIARMVTRPDEKGNPTLMMVKLFENAKEYLKGNTVYELVYNEYTEELQINEIGKSGIDNFWGRAYYDIETHIGPERTWLSKDEYINHERTILKKLKDNLSKEDFGGVKK